MRSEITAVMALAAKYETSLISRRLRGWLLAVILAPACAAVAGPAFARTVFDGAWSVLIITQSGTCDRAYRYGVQISNGRVLPDGHAAVGLQGQVARDGAIQVSVSAGNNRADGSGRLSGDRGSGLWRGQGSAGTCAGNWEAERREQQEK
jgi:hypothetical protein